LSRAHGKGPLRPAKGAALKDRFASHREQKDVIVKLYTGQGKTLIGLLMLHFQLNNGKGPALQPTTVVDRSSRSASEAERRLSASIGRFGRVLRSGCGRSSSTCRWLVLIAKPSLAQAAN